jgi:hypothetical protein
VHDAVDADTRARDALTHSSHGLQVGARADDTWRVVLALQVIGTRARPPRGPPLVYPTRFSVSSAGARVGDGTETNFRVRSRRGGARPERGSTDQSPLRVSPGRRDFSPRSRMRDA